MLRLIFIASACLFISSVATAQSPQSTPSIQIDTQRLSLQSGYKITVEGTFQGEIGSGVAIDTYDGLITSCIYADHFIVNDIDKSRLPRSVIDAQLFSPSSEDSLTNAVLNLPSLPAGPHHLTSEEDCGVAPFETVFRLEIQNDSNTLIQAIDTNGDGQFDRQLTEPQNSFALTINQPGIHRIKALLSDGTTVSRPIIVNSESSVITRAQPSLELFINAMTANDPDTASIAFLRSISDQTKASLSATLSTYPNFGSQLSTPVPVSVSEKFVSFLLSHDSGSIKRASVVELTPDRTGVWRISTM